jgi:hypothetical protein
MKLFLPLALLGWLCCSTSESAVPSDVTYSQIHAQLLNAYGIVPFGGPCRGNQVVVVGDKIFRRIECLPVLDVDVDIGLPTATLWGLAQAGDQTIYTSHVTIRNEVEGKVFDFSDDGMDVIACRADVAGEPCESCDVCSTDDGSIGSHVTCSFSPALDTNGTCLEDPLLRNARRNATAVPAAQSFNEVAENLFGIYCVCNNYTGYESSPSNPFYESVQKSISCSAFDMNALLVGNAMYPYDQVPIRTLQICDTSSTNTSVCQILFYDDAGMEVDSCSVFVDGSVGGSCQVCVDDDGVIGVIMDCPDCPIASTSGCVPNPVLGYTYTMTTATPSSAPPTTSMPTQPPTSNASPLGMTAFWVVVGMVVSFY